MEINGYKIEPKADLRGADLRGADLRGAILYGADLRGADLYKANLYGANLYGANLHKANLHKANLYGANLLGANLPDYGAAPIGYEVYGFKKLVDGSICVLKIPAEAKRTYSLVGRKARAEFAHVVEGSGCQGKNYSGVFYETGTTVYPDKYCDDIRVECSHGIHFFLTREEAERC